MSATVLNLNMTLLGDNLYFLWLLLIALPILVLYNLYPRILNPSPASLDSIPWLHKPIAPFGRLRARAWQLFYGWSYAAEGYEKVRDNLQWFFVDLLKRHNSTQSMESYINLYDLIRGKPK